MKKTLLVLCLSLLSAFSVLYADSKYYLDVGYSYGMYNEKVEEVTTDYTGQGIEISFSYFLNNNWGIYDSAYMHMINKADVTYKNYKGTDQLSNSSIISMNIGPTYRRGFTSALEMFARGGFNVTMYSLKNSTRTVSKTYLGVGGDLGINYLLSPSLNFYLTAGCGFGFDFYGETTSKTEFFGISVTSSESDSKSAVGVMPFIGVGMKF